MFNSSDPPTELSPRKPLPEFMKRQWKHGGAIILLGKLSIVFAVLVSFAVFTTVSPKISLVYRGLSKPVPTASCVVYDRPPRTASTTIASTLGACFVKKGYEVLRVQNRNRTELVAAMVSLGAERMAMVRSHMAMSEKDISLLEEYCGRLLYLTSAAPMKERLYSALKYSLTSYHGNSTIETDMVDLAGRREPKSAMREAFLEAYPYVRDEKVPLDVMPDRIVPDFVIRKKSLPQDMQSIMGALGCNNTLRTSNVHVATTEESKVLAAIKLKSGDAVYKWLLDVAKNNEQGLKKARGF